jgi:mannose-6-phosphate isomerase-like protein (cupin superfamily)
MIQTKRPWGSYFVLQSEETFQVKKLVVQPGMRLSLQSHLFRSEHWFVVSGSGVALIDGYEKIVGAGDSIDIAIGLKHRIACSSKEPLVFIEVQTGSSFDEEDITRFDDDFGRL